MKKTIAKFRLLFVVVGILLFILGATIILKEVNSGRLINECTLKYGSDYEKHIACFKIALENSYISRDRNSSILYVLGTSFVIVGGYGYFLNRKNGRR